MWPENLVKARTELQKIFALLFDEALDAMDIRDTSHLRVVISTTKCALLKFRDVHLSMLSANPDANLPLLMHYGEVRDWVVNAIDDMNYFLDHDIKPADDFRPPTKSKLSEPDIQFYYVNKLCRDTRAKLGISKDSKSHARLQSRSTTASAHLKPEPEPVPMIQSRCVERDTSCQIEDTNSTVPIAIANGEDFEYGNHSLKVPSSDDVIHAPRT